MRLIDADALIESFNYTAPELFADREFLIAKIDNAPTVTHDKRTETHGVCSDLISREDAIDEMDKLWGDIKRTNKRVAKGHEAVYLDMRATVKSLPSADRPTVDKEYLIDLIQEAVYDGEACAKLLDLVDRPTGEWQGYNADNPDWTRKDGTPIFMVCDQCHGTVLNTGSAHWHYCPNCGTRMTPYKGGEDE